VDYCGTGCQTGPCTSSSSNWSSPILSLSLVVTGDFFNGIIGQADVGCQGKNFYTHSAFLHATESFNSFGSTDSTDIQKQEIAAFFAHETGIINHPSTIVKQPHNDHATLERTTSGVVPFRSHGTSITSLRAWPSGINNIECDGDNTQEMDDMVSLYTKYCQQLRVATGDRLTWGVVPIILGSLCF
ncbi:hypothetical protein V2J09_021731, partial [Rumex salicifolius]